MALRAVGHCVYVGWRCAIVVAAMWLSDVMYLDARAQIVVPAPEEMAPYAAMDAVAVPGLLSHFRTHASDASTETTDAPENTSWHQKTSVDVEPSVENWAGYDGYRRVASLYGGATWAIGGNLRQNGLRLRLVNGGSAYSYSGYRNNAVAEDAVWTNFTGRAWFTDVLAGWQQAKGATTVKVFAGWSWSNHVIGPYDSATRVQGTAKGAKLAFEVWHNWSPQLWSSLDLAAAQPHRTFSAQLRTGWRVDDAWSLGPEASMTGHAEATLQRAGVFVRREDLVGELTISAGVLRARGDQPTSYGTAQYLRRF
jgi:Cellulose biosynthesis protein BcsS